MWTGLLRVIEAKAYTPGALWFCFVMGIVSITAGFLYRLEKKLSAAITALIPVIFVLGFYLYRFIGQPEDNATYRVGVIILASITELIVILMPDSSKTKDN